MALQELTVCLLNDNYNTGMIKYIEKNHQTKVGSGIRKADRETGNGEEYKR